MNTAAIDKINNKLKVMPDNFVHEVLQFLEFLNFKSINNVGGSEFLLTDAQTILLDKRSATPIEQCITADELMGNLKNKYGV